MQLNRVYSVGLALAVILVCIAGCYSNTSTVSATVYRKVLDQKTIRCGYVIAAPSCYVDPESNKLTGYSVDIIDEAGKRLGLKVEWAEEASWATMIEGLRSGRYEIIGSTSWQNSTRGREALFSETVCFSGVGIYVRSDDERFNNALHAIDDPAIRIAIADGELSEEIAKIRFPKAATVSLPQLVDYSQLLLDVVERKADVAFMENNSASMFLEKNPGSLKNLVPARPVRIYAEGFMMPMGEFELKSMIDITLKELHNEGFVDDVVKRYEKAPYGKLRVRRPYELQTTTGPQ